MRGYWDKQAEDDISLRELAQLRYLRAEILKEEAVGDPRAGHLREQERVERYITAIPDSRLRQIFRLRFVQGYSWQQVAGAMGISADAAKKAVYRWVGKKK